MVPESDTPEGTEAYFELIKMNVNHQIPTKIPKRMRHYARNYKLRFLKDTGQYDRTEKI
jgi:hypothetical protein